MAKLTQEFYETLSDLEFEQFMQIYLDHLEEFYNDLDACVGNIIDRNYVKSSIFKLRQISVDIEKMGFMFRKRTIEMEKKNV